VTDPAAWRAAKEDKRKATPGGAAVTPQDSSQRVETDADQATNVPAPGRNGKARVCATKDMEFDSYREIKLPVKTVFKDSGHLEGDVRDPSGRVTMRTTTGGPHSSRRTPLRSLESSRVRRQASGCWLGSNSRNRRPAPPINVYGRSKTCWNTRQPQAVHPSNSGS
jgi:hypothetical protein